MDKENDFDPRPGEDLDFSSDFPHGFDFDFDHMDPDADLTGDYGTPYADDPPAPAVRAASRQSGTGPMSGAGDRKAANPRQAANARQASGARQGYRPGGGSPDRSSGGSDRGGSGHPPTGRGGRSHRKGSPLLSALFFPCALLYHELLLRAFDRDVRFFSAGLLPTLLFSLSTGFLVFAALDLIPAKRFSRAAGGVLMFLTIVVLCAERGIKGFFSMYYGVLAAMSTAGDAVTNFAEDTKLVILNLIPFILLALVPFVLYILFRKTVLRDRGQIWLTRVLALFLAAMCFLFGFMFSNIGEMKPYYTYDFTTNNGIPSFGLVTSVRLELQYALFGAPEQDLSDFIQDDDELTGDTGSTGSEGQTGGDTGSEGQTGGDTGSEGQTGTDTGTEGQTGTEGTVPPVPVEYGFNELPIDFDALASSASDKTLRSMHEYFGSLTPSRQNEYTGLFKGKNLILLCAESFDDYAVDPELTPTLYRLTQREGFVFTNFYQPDWTLSTCGGEFSVTTGVIPNWVGKSDSARTSIGNAMPTTLGNMFRAIGYSTPAWHNGEYTYYSRDKYLTTYGYDYAGEDGGGLDLPTDNWPRSDKELIEATCDSYINEYLRTGKPFHAYYMTISGHGAWTFARNHRAAQYRDLVEARFPDLSEPCQAYIASSIDLDRALEVLVKKLEDAGIADDTLIVLCADHYPYFLATGNNNQNDPTDYYNELNRYFGKPEDSELVTSRYKNTLLMWSASIPRTVVDTPCYSCDILPTVANLFGLEYDSRLYTGRDIFATNYEADKFSTCMPLVIFANNKRQGNSWITAAGTYEASTGVFTPNPGVTVDDSYVSRVKDLVSGKLRMSKLIITEDYYREVY